MITRDATEYLIPNEELVSREVVNWSYSNCEVRLKLPTLPEIRIATRPTADQSMAPRRGPGSRLEPVTPS